MKFSEINEVTRDEVLLLDSDLREIYTDYGTNKLVLLKHSPNASKVDDVYDQYVSEATYVPYPVMGMILVNTTDGNMTDLGEKMKAISYRVTILSSSITEQGLKDITCRDKIKYGNEVLDIISVVPQPTLGDYCIQYRIVARGESLDWEDVPHGE